MSWTISNVREFERLAKRVGVVSENLVQMEEFVENRMPESIAKELEDKGRDWIQNKAGVGRQWTGPVGGRDISAPGRFVTGRMRDAFSVVPEGNGVKAGWRSAERYIFAQDAGFEHYFFGNPSGFRVPGMEIMAKVDSWFQAVDKQIITVAYTVARESVRAIWSRFNLKQFSQYRNDFYEAVHGVMFGENAPRSIFGGR